MAEEPARRHEYNHYDLGYGLHYGIHTRFGEHVALGTGVNMVHIYPYKIFIGDNPENQLVLTPDQQAIVQALLSTMRRRVHTLKPVVTEGELDNGTS